MRYCTGTARSGRSSRRHPAVRLRARRGRTERPHHVKAASAPGQVGAATTRERIQAMSFIGRSGRHAATLAGIALAAAAAFPVIGAQAAARGPAAGQAPDSFSVLESVYCTGSTNCWAVGFQGTGMAATLNRV